MSTAESYQLLLNEKKGSYLLMNVRKHQTTLVRSTTLSENQKMVINTSVAKKKKIKKKLVFKFLLTEKQKTVKQQY